MKKLFAALCCCALLTNSVVAQETAQDNTDQAKKEWKQKEGMQKEGMQKDGKQTDGKKAAKKQYMGSNKIVGTYIYGTNDESVGDINSLTLDQKGNVHCAIVGIGGVAGVGETEIAVPWEAFKCEYKVEDGKKTCRVTLPMTAKELEKAPVLEKEEYAELYDDNWIATNAKFYGIETAAKAPKEGTMLCVTDIAGLQLSGNKNMKMAAKGSDQKTYTKDKSTATKKSDEMEDLGTIEEVVIDLDGKKACYVVLGDDSGILSEKHVAVPFEQVKFSKKDGEHCAEVAATAKDVEAAPKLTPGEYQELDKKNVRKKVDAGFKTR
ncbi:PRC-barrel domain-containing protein [Mariniblastus sp.]|nr:PRC-barrel domain-containing protein [Mariniblastus sp.]